MNSGNCLQSDRLRDYVLGQLDDAAAQKIDEHLESCSSCLSALDQVDAEVHAPFVPLTRTLSGPAHDDPLFQELVLQAKALGGDRPASARSEALEGQVLGNYRLGELLGAGGMGQVFIAEHCRLRHVVAIKLLAPDLIRSEAARARFRREVETMARLRSPHIVAALDAGEAGGRDYLVMEYVAGRNLGDVVRYNGPLGVRQALDYLLQAAKGLRDAHAAGIVHRDVKPANLLLDSGGVVKVLDLGLARLNDAPTQDTDLTGQHAVMGTAAYMAPEQAVDVRRADARADVYSLGCTLFYLLTGKPPFEGSTTMKVLIAHREQAIPSLRTARQDCPAALCALCRAMTAKKPMDRPRLDVIIARLEEMQRPGGMHVFFSRRSALLAAASLVGTVAVGLALTFGLAKDKSDRPEAPGGQKAMALTLVTIPAGELWMGASESDKDASADERPRHKVAITERFLMSRTKVTQAQYEAVMGANPSAFSVAGRFKERVKDRDTRQHPVESISWLDAVRFCNRLSEREGLTPYYEIDGKTVTIHSGNGYRLPTEAEWELACRAGTDGLWSFGDRKEDLKDHAWFADNSDGTTHPVGQKKPNRWGLFDMHGNVPEWCWDRYDPEYYKKSPTSDPPGPGPGEFRVHRGGAWNSSAAQTRASCRDSRGIGYSVLDIVGLRVARNAAP
jgi:formylglycine-generating enzyme required for sulfatase activity